jgi:uncharacterized protein DUF5658
LSGVRLVRNAPVLALLISLSVVPSVHAQATDTVAASAVAQVLPTPVAPATRPAALFPLYGSFIGLQALDFDSTRRAITSGAGREANPAARMAVGSPAALLALKAGTTAAVILSCERLRKDHHPLAAVMLMIGVNSAYAVVTAHNYAVLHRPH